MKKILLILAQTLLFASSPDAGLKSYQEKYSVCKGTTNYQIANCLINGNLNFARFRGDTNAYRKIHSDKIRDALQTANLYRSVMDLIPQTKRYTKLKAYVDYLYTISDQYTAPKFKGNEEEDTLRIKRVFNLLLNANLDENTEITSEFETALLIYQERHGLEVDGKIGPKTKKALQQSISQIIRKVQKNLTLERISMPKGPQYVLVNIPEFKMHYYENYEDVLNMKIVVGKRTMRTPVFNRKMKYIVKNPRWNVPPSIYKNEYADKTEEFLKKNGFAFNSEGKLYQKSGSKNALGLVKFLFPNKFNVYMHDTPSKSLFNKTTRAFSHGCIRLEKPLELLNILGYDYDTKMNKWIPLEKQIPVYVEYHTVWVDENDIVQFRNDIYGYEKKLFY